MQVVVDSILSQYQLIGKGRLVIFLHGWGTNSDNFRHLADEISKNYQVLLVELPGFGRSQTPQVAFNLDDYCDYVEKLRLKLKLPEVHAIIGHSNGGAIGIKYANKYICEKLILIGASGIRNNQSVKKKLLLFLSKSSKILQKISPQLYAKLRNQTYQKIVKSNDYASLNDPIMKQTISNIFAEDLEMAARKIRQPTLLIYGKNDQATNSEVWLKYQAAIKHNQLILIDNAAHYVHQEQPTMVLSNIKEFLQ